MMDRLLALLAYGVLLGFLGILVWNVPELDLGLVVLATLALAGFDVVKLLQQHNRQKQRE
ncbi:hypothetical protein [Paracoccus sediminicola]|uniref:hypothetical protein n=1 Tax=Paracoccus sediminicola TaxID=3017783 RepID=UPI0022F00CBB|nr:hypothetical protein [Paracoccus sediminicola]WBU58135.1 hypothetical protein PAF18_06850 [Paracoccus sediminicola]